ncbi:MAG: hypothetical protein U0414_40140 [Polyangiaceae bacterium]
MRTLRRPLAALVPLFVAFAVESAACDDATTTTSAGGSTSASATTIAASTSTDAVSSSSGGVTPAALTAKLEDTQFVTSPAAHASLELRFAADLAPLLGRDPRRFDGFSATTDISSDPARGTLDPLGFALVIEARQAADATTRALTLETGAGLSTQFAPLLNPTHVVGDPSVTLLRDRLASYAIAAHATGMASPPDLVVVPAPADLVNPYGFPGIYPTFAEYTRFATALAPIGGADHACSIDRDPAHTTPAVADYECDATTLSLVDHAQAETFLAPEALGWSAWNQALFVASGIGLHDVAEHSIVTVPGPDLPQVGVASNTVVGQYQDPADPTGQTLVAGAPGTYFGVSALDGFQALAALHALDEKAALLLASLSTTDASTLDGIPIAGALAYDYTSPLRWFPASVAVPATATATMTEEAHELVPDVSALAVGDARSRLADLSALIGAYATVYALTDASGALGGKAPLPALFDGAPFAPDDGAPSGEASLHDRSLAILKIALVDLDRAHLDSASMALVDEATIANGAAKPGATLSAVTASDSIVALRTARRALDGSLSRAPSYAPDALGAASALDGTSVAGAPYAGTIGARIVDLARLQADAIRERLVGASGVVLNAYDVANNLPDLSTTSVLSQASGLRGLLEAYLLTGEDKYRLSAQAVYAALESKFWNADVRLYRTKLGEDDKMSYDPKTVAELLGALRVYRAVFAAAPGEEALAAELDERLLRVLKVVVNGWNDLDGDDQIDTGECLGGRLLMGERSRTGGLGIAADKGDRDHDCVPDVVSAKRPALLGAKLVLTKKAL